MKRLIIAVDGTAGSGKTSVLTEVANELNYVLIDTGLMYRAFTIFGVDQKINFENTDEINALISKFNYSVKGNKVFVNDIDVTDRLQTSDVLRNINKVTVVPEVRTMMVQKMRELAMKHVNEGVIELGRDITSVVLPDADLKIYMDSSSKVRAERRFNQNIRAGITDMEFDEIEQAIIDRDKSDKGRTVGPLVQTADAWYIDNSKDDIQEVVNMIIKKIRTMEGN